MTWIVGAGGAMGRMHIQRALEMPNGPATIIATNRGEARLHRLIEDFAGQAAAQWTANWSPSALRLEPARLAGEVDRLTDGRGCDDAIVIVPNPAVVDDVLPYLAPDGLLVIFAGVPAGNLIDAARLITLRSTAPNSPAPAARPWRISCASWRRFRGRTLSASQCVAAIGGMQAMHDGLAGRHGTDVCRTRSLFIRSCDDLPLLSLAELEGVLPDVYAQLAPGPRGLPRRSGR